MTGASLEASNHKKALRTCSGVGYGMAPAPTRLLPGRKQKNPSVCGVTPTALTIKGGRAMMPKKIDDPQSEGRLASGSQFRFHGCQPMRDLTRNARRVWEESVGCNWRQGGVKEIVRTAGLSGRIVPSRSLCVLAIHQDCRLAWFCWCGLRAVPFQFH